MAWIKVVDEREATGGLQDAYTQVAAARGYVPNIVKLHSLSPALLRAHFAFYRELMFGTSELSRAERETIAVAVSAANNCHY